MEDGQPLPRVLSVQSHVVHGYVGNKCAVFPLQVLGLEVDPIYSVQFSNHTGYPVFKGAVFDGEQLRALVAGLEANKLLTHTHLLTGYIGSLSLLQAIADLCRSLKQHSPNLTYVCDPVLGDEDRLYVAPELVAAYRSTIVPLASVLVPNQFEAEELITDSGGGPDGETGAADGGGAGRARITSLADAVAACDKLHDRGPHTVIITSMSLPGDPDGITLVASTRLPQRRRPPPPQQQQQQQQPGDGDGEEGQQGPGGSAAAAVEMEMDGSGEAAAEGRGGATRLFMRIDRIKAYFTGTGDLFAALLLAWMHHHPGDLATAIEKAVGGLQAVLADTVRHCGPAALEANRTAEVCAQRELRLIPCQGKLQDPPIRYRCELLLTDP